MRRCLPAHVPHREALVARLHRTSRSRSAPTPGAEVSALSSTSDQALTGVAREAGVGVGPRVDRRTTCAFASPLNDSARARLITCPP
jgi:hypothetical protein